VDHKQKIKKICFINFEGGGWERNFLNPHISANFGFRELKIYMPLDLHEPHLHSEFYDLTLKTGHGGTIVEIKNFNCSKGCRFHTGG